MSLNNNISLINLNSQFNPFYSSINIDSSGNVGIGKSNPSEILDVSGNIKFSGNIIGSGYHLTSLNATNITSGVLSVNRGGTGATNLTAGSILVGNGTSTLIQPSNLTWNTGTNTLSATNFVGSGAGLTSLTATNITGNINVSQGGTGLTTLTAGRILVGNGTSALTQSANLTWDNTNNRLGIGITNPQYILDIQGVQPTLRLLDTRSDGNAIISFKEFTDNYGYDIAYIGDTDNKLYIRGYDNSPTARIDMTFNRITGNVGIGTTTPNTKLDVNGNISLKSDSASSLFWSGTLTSLGRANGPGDYSGSAVAGDLVLRSVGKLILQSGTGIGAIVIDTSNNINIDSGILYIDASNNNVGIGTTQPNKKLHVTGDTRIEGSLIVNGTVTQINTNVGTTEQLLITNDGTGPALIVNQTGAQPIIEFQDDGSTCFKIFDGGNLGIGTASKVVSVDISGNLKLSGSITGSGSGLSALNASNITGNINVAQGGTGLTTLTSGQLLIGGANVIQTANLTWDNTNNRLGIGKTNPTTSLDVNGTVTSTLFIGSGASLSSLTASNITGNINVAQGGTGLTTLTSGQLLIGGTNVIQTPNLIWNSGTNTLSATNFVGSGAGLTALNATNITGNINVAQGGTGATTLTAGQILVGNGTGALLQSANLTWDNTNNRLGIGITNPSSVLDVTGNINFTGFLYKNNVLFAGGLSQGMTVQTKHLTYTQMDVKNNVGWEPINDDLSTGFVISITPTNSASKILINMIAHIGCVMTGDNRWWGIKLYRKIDTGNWTEVTAANGTETGAAATTVGTPCWITNNQGMNDNLYNYFMSNSTGTFLDAPNTTSIVYYTAYWNNRIGDGATATSSSMYINRAENMNDAYRPATSSSWTASEIWDLGTPYIPPAIDNTITISSGNVGINASPNSNYKLIINHGTSGSTGITCFPLKISAGAYSNFGNLTATLIGFGTENNTWAKCAIGHCRTGTYDIGSIVFCCNSIADGTNVSMSNEKMRITDSGNVGIGKTNPATILDINGTTTSTLFSGSGASLSSLNASNINAGTLTVSNGGTGLTTLTAGQLLIGGTNVIQTPNLTWDNTNNRLGIVTTVPLLTLDISGNLLIRSYGTTGSGTRGIFFRSDHLAVNPYNCSILTFDHGGGGPTDGISINGYGGVSFCTGANTRQERMRIEANGNIGIGKTPGYMLDVNGTINCTADMRVGGDWYWQASKNMYLQTSTNNFEWSMDMLNQNTYTGCYWQVWSDKTGLGSILACRGDTGNVGIRNTAPGYALDVAGDINITGSFRVNGTAFSSSSSQWTTAGSNIHYNSGNIGIGTTVINEKLTISGTSGRHAMFINTTTSSSSYVGFSNSANDSLAYLGVDGIGLTNYVYGALTLGTWKDKPILFTTGSTNTEKMRIDSNGYIGIGKTNPSALLHIEKFISPATTLDLLNMSLDANWGLKVQQSYTAVGNIQYNLIHKYNGTDYNSLTFKGANVGIGTTNPTTAKLVITGTAGTIGLDMSSTDQYAEMRVIRNSLSSLDKHLYLNLGSGATTAEIKLYSNSTEIFKVGNTGVSFAHSYWHSSLDGLARLYFSNADRTYIRGHGSTPIEFRNASDSTIATISSTGNLNIVGNEIYIGPDSGSSRIFLGGGAAGDTGHSLSVIESRNYASTEKTELLLFKGNDGDASSGPDRIRLRAAAIAFDTYTPSSSDRTAESIRMYINPDGNVGIGNLAPTGPLCVGNSQLSGSNGFIVIGKNNGAGGSRSQYIGYNTNFDLVIGDYSGGTGPLVEAFKLSYAAPANSLIINSGGSVGIGRTPGYRLDVEGSICARNEWLRTTGLCGLYSDTYACHFYPNDAQYGNWRIHGNQANGWSGLRFTDAEITVMAGNNGTKRCGFHYNTGTVGWGFYIDENRDAFCPGNITAYWSDRRLKTNLSKLSNFDNVLTSLTGYSFNWNEKGQKILSKSADELDIGLIAQDVQKVIPQAVRVNKAGMRIDEDESSFDYLTIHYDKIIPFLVEGYKHHKDIIEKQNKEIEILKQENNDLKQKYDNLLQDMIIIKKTLKLI